MRVSLGNRRYLFVGISPGITDQKPLARCFQVPTYIQNPCADDVAIKQELRLNGQEFNLAAARYHVAHPETVFLNPREALCRNGLYYAIDSRKIYYSDYSHFTKDGARKVIEHYRDVVLSLHPG